MVSSAFIVVSLCGTPVPRGAKRPPIVRTRMSQQFSWALGQQASPVPRCCNWTCTARVQHDFYWAPRLHTYLRRAEGIGSLGPVRGEKALEQCEPHQAGFGMVHSRKKARWQRNSPFFSRISLRQSPTTAGCMTIMHRVRHNPVLERARVSSNLHWASKKPQPMWISELHPGMFFAWIPKGLLVF